MYIYLGTAEWAALISLMMLAMVAGYIMGYIVGHFYGRQAGWAAGRADVLKRVDRLFNDWRKK